jgi:hypothetical protein
MSGIGEYLEFREELNVFFSLFSIREKHKSNTAKYLLCVTRKMNFGSHVGNQIHSGASLQSTLFYFSSQLHMFHHFGQYNGIFW